MLSVHFAMNVLPCVVDLWFLDQLCVGVDQLNECKTILKQESQVPRFSF